jgi:hypothetical protein
VKVSIKAKPQIGQGNWKKLKNTLKLDELASVEKTLKNIIF